MTLQKKTISQLLWIIYRTHLYIGAVDSMFWISQSNWDSVSGETYWWWICQMEFFNAVCTTNNNNNNLIHFHYIWVEQVWMDILKPGPIIPKLFCPVLPSNGVVFTVLMRRVHINASSRGIHDIGILWKSCDMLAGVFRNGGGHGS